MWTAGARHMVIKDAGNPSQVLYDYCSYPLPSLRTLTPYRHFADRDGVEAVRKQLLTKECNVTISLIMKGNSKPNTCLLMFNKHHGATPHSATHQDSIRADFPPGGTGLAFTDRTCCSISMEKEHFRRVVLSPRSALLLARYGKFDALMESPLSGTSTRLLILQEPSNEPARGGSA